MRLCKQIACSGQYVACIVQLTRNYFLSVWKLGYFNAESTDIFESEPLVSIEIEQGNYPLLSAILVDSAINKLVVIAASDECLNRWEFFPDTETVATTYQFVTDSIASYCSCLRVDRFGERLCYGDSSISVRTEHFRRIRNFENILPPASLVALEFAGTNEDYVFAIYSNSAVTVWRVSDSRRLCSIAKECGEAVCARVVDLYGSTRTEHKLVESRNLFVCVLCRNGSMVMYELLRKLEEGSDAGGVLFDYRCCNTLDLQRELRFAQSMPAAGKGGLDRTAMGDSALVAVRRDLVPLAMLFIPALYSLEPGASAAPPAVSNTVNLQGSHFCVVTSTAVVFVSNSIFRVVKTMPLTAAGAPPVSQVSMDICAAPRNSDDGEGDGGESGDEQEAEEEERGADEPRVYLHGPPRHTYAKQKHREPPPSAGVRHAAVLNIALLSSLDGSPRVLRIPLYNGDSKQAEHHQSELRGESLREKLQKQCTVAEATAAGVSTPLSFLVSPSSLSVTISDSSPKKSLLEKTFRPPQTPVALQGARPTSTHSAKTRGNWETAKVDRNGRIVDQPVTFHNRIKSSGYGQQTGAAGSFKGTSTQRKPGMVTLKARSASTPRGIKADSKQSAERGARVRHYPMDCAPMTVHQPHNNFPLAGVDACAPIASIAFNEDGSYLALATAESAVLTLKLPVHRSRGELTSYMGHNGRIASVSFSSARQCNEQMLLSMASDQTARIWKCGKTENAAVVFSHTRHSPGSDYMLAGMGTTKAMTSTSQKQALAGTADGASRNRPYGCDLSAVQYYYQDKFVLLAARSSVLMYSYETEGTDAKNDLKPLGGTGHYCARLHQLGAAPYHHLRHKKLHVLDAAAGTVLRSVESAHNKAIHCIALPHPSIYAQFSGGGDSYSQFLTAAIDNVISVWDIRSPHCVMQYTEHLNKRESVGCSLSPCMRYVATGSEDRAARIFDIRTGRTLARLTGHRDVVSSAVFNPIFPQLATSSYDGTLRFYVDPGCSDNMIGILNLFDSPSGSQNG